MLAHIKTHFFLLFIAIAFVCTTQATPIPQGTNPLDGSDSTLTSTLGPSPAITQSLIKAAAGTPLEPLIPIIQGAIEILQESKTINDQLNLALQQPSLEELMQKLPPLLQESQEMLKRGQQLIQQIEQQVKDLSERQLGQLQQQLKQLRVSLERQNEQLKGQIRELSEKIRTELQEQLQTMRVELEDIRA